MRQANSSSTYLGQIDTVLALAAAALPLLLRVYNPADLDSLAHVPSRISYILNLNGLIALPGRANSPGAVNIVIHALREHRPVGVDDVIQHPRVPLLPEVTKVGVVAVQLLEDGPAVKVSRLTAPFYVVEARLVLEACGEHVRHDCRHTVRSGRKGVGRLVVFLFGGHAFLHF